MRVRFRLRTGYSDPNPPFTAKNVIAHIEDKCTAFALSMLRMTSSQAFQCPAVVHFFDSNGNEFRIYMAPDSTQPATPETTYVQVTCNAVAADNSGCNDWFIDPSRLVATKWASDSWRGNWPPGRPSLHRPRKNIQWWKPGRLLLQLPFSPDQTLRSAPRRKGRGSHYCLVSVVSDRKVLVQGRHDRKLLGASVGEDLTKQ